MYKLLFKSDLKSVKTRTLEQLQDLQSKQDLKLKDLESLKQENLQLAKTIKRYKQLFSDQSL